MEVRWADGREIDAHESRQTIAVVRAECDIAATAAPLEFKKSDEGLPVDVVLIELGNASKTLSQLASLSTEASLLRSLSDISAFCPLCCARAQKQQPPDLASTDCQLGLAFVRY